MKKNKGFTLIEVLSTIVILVIVFLIGRMLVLGIVEKVYIEACLANKRSMIHSARNYLTLNPGKMLPANNGEKLEVTVNELMNNSYIKPVLDPRTKELVDIIESKVIVTRENNNYTYEAVIVSPTCSGETGTEIVVGDSEEIMWGGWITLHLYYPESSTERKWRLGEEGELRSDPMLIWQDYTGAITIPIDRTQDVWISYKIGDEEFIIPPAGKLLVDIVANPYGKQLVPQTVVTIRYDKDAETKEYRVGNSGWLPYEGSFIVSENTVVEARASKKEQVYDSEGNLLMTRNIAGRDMLYINNIGIEEEDLVAPTITRLSPVEEDEVARVRITYPEGAIDKVYKLNYGMEQIYSEEISIERYGTLIIAYYYDVNGKRSKSSSIIINNPNTGSPHQSTSYNPITTGPVGGSGVKTTPERGVDYPGSSVPSPIISITPTSLTTEVEVSVNAPATADKVYIKLGRYGSYQAYTLPIVVKENMEVYAYYVTYEGYKSDTGYRRITNIKDQRPHVVIEADPYPYSGRYGAESVNVTIIGEDYDTLEYSENGVVYQEYTGTFTVTENKRIYARATNEHGVRIEYLDITNIGELKRPSPIKKLDVSITVIPEPSISTERYNEVKVTIDYDEKATGKYYRLGRNGSLQTYTGEFTITKNTTIYAYALSSNGRGEVAKLVDNLSSGISEPIIRVEPSNEASSKVRVFIEYDKYSVVRRYSLDGGSGRDYNGYFEIDKNETVIRAYSVNDLGEESESTYVVRNIIPEPPVLLVDKGNYYILKLNYPPSSTGHEYKFKESGEWKNYKPAGIMLIKPNKKDEVIENGTLVKIEDENGNLITFTGDYYLIDVPINEIMENIFMRWDKETPQSPHIILSTEEPTRELNVVINYHSSLIKKEYKIVRPDGSSEGWKEYTGVIPINEKNTVVYARGMNSTEVWSEETIKKITNIDDEKPTITLIADLTTPSQRVGVKVVGSDDTGVSLVKWAPDVRDIEYFKNNGTVIPNESIFNALHNGTYTVYVEDMVGNSSIKTITIENIDLTPPVISINVTPELSVGTEVEITIDFGDSETREYKIGETNQTWSNYTDAFTLTSYQVLENNWKNNDGTVTIYARGKDNANNETLVTRKVLSLDLDAPSTPVITSNYGYPILTSYGVKFDGRTTIDFDTRPGILNEYSLDNGDTWIIYEGNFEATVGTILARSTKTESDLQVSVSKTISIPGDALGLQVYDDNDGTYIENVTNKYMKIDSSVRGKSVRVRIKSGQQIYSGIHLNSYIRFLDKNKSLIITHTYDNPTIREVIIDVPADAEWIRYEAVTTNDNNKPRLYEIQVSNEPIFSLTNGYMVLHIDPTKGIRSPYQMVTINYFPTSVERYYRIGSEGEWLEYEDNPIKVNQGETIYAYGKDFNGNVTRLTSSHTVNVTDALISATYDNDNSTYIENVTNKYMKIDSSVRGKSVRVLIMSGRQINSGNPLNSYIRFLDKNKSLIITHTYDNPTIREVIIDVPADAEWIRYEAVTTNANNKPRLYEIRVNDEPRFSVTNGYMLLHADPAKAIKSPYQMVKIDYFPTSVEKYYRIGTEGDWQEYKGEPIKVDQSQTIYAYGKDQYGNNTIVTSSHTVNVGNALLSQVYDGNDNTYIENVTNKYMKVDSSMYNKQIRVRIRPGAYATGSINAYIRFLDKDQNLITSYTYSGYDIRNATLTVPENSEWIFYVATSSGYVSSRLYEITPLDLSPNYQGLVPKMTSNTSPAPFEITASSSYNASHAPYMAFDQSIVTLGWASNSTDLADGNVWLQVKLDQARSVKKYYIISRNDGAVDQTPKAWKLQGSDDGTSWNDLDERINQTSWVKNDVRWYEFNNTTNYLYYRLYITENNNASPGTGSVAIEEFNIFE